MKKLTQTQTTIVLLLVILIIGLFLFRVPQKVLQQIKMAQTKQAQTETETLSVAGSVGAVNIGANSFTLINVKEKKEVTVRAGSSTKLVRLVFPFDLKNPPANKTFTPKLQPATLKDLKAGDQVFVRASQPIKTGKDVVNPIEIQILP